MDNLIHRKLVVGEPVCRQWPLLIPVLLLVAAVYANTIHGDFVFDDLRLIPKNPEIRWTEISWDNVARLLERPRPVAMLSFALNYYFHGYEVTGYHLVNIAIHMLAGVVLYLFIKTTVSLPVLKREDSLYRYTPLVAAAIWLLHPIQTQSVSYIIQRMNSLASLWYILSMFLYVKFRIAEGRGMKSLFICGCVLSGLLAFATKEMTVTLPLCILCFEWYFFRDLGKKWALRLVGGLLVAGVALGGLAYLNPGLIPWGVISQGYEPYHFTMGERLLTEANVLMLYISLLIFPHPSRLNLDYDFPLSHSIISPPVTIVSMAAILMLVVILVVSARRERLLSFCLLWFLGNLLVESTIIPLDLVFEHRLYLPSMLAVLGGVVMGQRFLSNRMVRMTVFWGLMAFFSLWTHERNRVWAEPLSLFIDSAVKMPGNPRPAYNVACEYAKRGRAGEAVFWLKKCVECQGFSRWDLIERDADLDAIRDSGPFQEFVRTCVPAGRQEGVRGYKADQEEGPASLPPPESH